LSREEIKTAFTASG
jgi:hypothetical protein